MIVRRRGMPLLRGALIGGSAYAMGRRAASNAQREAQQDAAIADLQAPPQPPPPEPVQASVRTATVADQLLQLGQMVQQGLLTQDEYAAAKTKLLST
ncbi:SHOCT domain-containing protein [Spirillospora sp. NPDC047279]|uniref:SHOCT domain-containing protein n=1 Tax=Spirillospora sp. NPDC047279 TaxID=3155478 RepID=UPI0033CBECB9